MSLYKFRKLVLYLQKTKDMTIFKKKFRRSTNEMFADASWVRKVTDSIKPIEQGGNHAQFASGIKLIQLFVEKYENTLTPSGTEDMIDIANEMLSNLKKKFEHEC